MKETDECFYRKPFVCLFVLLDIHETVCGELRFEYFMSYLAIYDLANTKLSIKIFGQNHENALDERIMR